MTAIPIARDLVVDAESNLKKDLIVQLAGSPCAAWTAYKGMYDQLNIPLPSLGPSRSGRIVIIGASGGVGSFSLQLAKRSNFSDIVAVCSKKHEEYVNSLGATHFIDYHTEDISAGLTRILASSSADTSEGEMSDGDPRGQGIDFVIDCVGSTTVTSVVEHMSYGGRILPLVSFANFGDVRCFMKSISIAQLALGGGHNGGLRARLRLKEVGEVVTQMILRGELSVPVTEVVHGLGGVGDKLT